MSTKTTQPQREPVLRRASGHPADDLPARPGSGQQVDQTPQTPTPEPTPAPPAPSHIPTPTPAPAGVAVITKTPVDVPPASGKHGPADTYGIAAFGDEDTRMHSARIRKDTKDLTEAAVDHLRIQARQAGGNAKLISLASITDAALREFIGRYAPDLRPYPTANAG